MRVDGNQGSTLHYEPNSYGEWKEQLDLKEPPLKLNGDADIWDFREDDSDYFTQPGKLFNLMNDEPKRSSFANTARNMGDAPKEIKIKHISHCFQADPAYGEGVAKALEISMEDVNVGSF